MADKPNNEKTIWDMHGKIVVVTGANQGIGRIMARELARSKARVIMACRSMDHARKVSTELKAELGFGDLEVRELDLAHPESILQFAKSLVIDHPRINGLINNAGVSMRNLERTQTGMEITFAINVLGPQLLTTLLVDQLREAGPARIVFVASDHAGGLDFSDLNFEKRRFTGDKAYKQTKQANRMLTREWARRLEPDQVWVNSMTPGLMPNTGLFRQAKPAEKFFMRQLGRLIGVPIEDGADTAIWLACEPKLENETGGFYLKRKNLKCKFFDPEAEKILWERCDDLLRRHS